MPFPLSWPEYHAAFRNAAEAAGFSEEMLCETPDGPVTIWTSGKPENDDWLYISSGIHGDEPAGPFALLELMREGFFSSGNDDISWAVCPALNPTGLAAGSRENSDGIDLNRDYRVKTTAEVAAHTCWFSRRGKAPSLFLSLHEDWESSGFYFYEINHGTDCLQRTRKILTAVSPWFPVEISRLIDGHAVREPGWIYHPPEADEPGGWPEAIYLSHFGCPLSFTFETPSRADFSLRVAAHKAAVKAACGKS